MNESIHQLINEISPRTTALSIGRIRFAVIGFILIFCCISSHAQVVFPEIPDSLYLPNQLIILFADGILEDSLIGNYGERSDYPYGNYGTAELPINTTLIKSDALVEYLLSRGIHSLRKVVPWMDPLQDTLSITRSGDTIRTFPYWDYLLADFDPIFERNMVNEAFYLVSQYYTLVRWAEPNFKFTVGGAGRSHNTGISTFNRSVLFNDPHWNDQTSMHDFQSGGIDVEPCWTVTAGELSTKIAVIDDGIYNSNPDFTDKLHFPQSQGGKVVYGIAGTGHHGTQMAGIIGARNNNTIGVSGIVGGTALSAGSQLYILDIGDNMSTNNMINALAEAFQSTSANPVGFGCSIVSMSLYNFIPEQFVRQGIADAYRHGTIVAACSGNENRTQLSYPAAYDETYIIAVGGKDEFYAKYSMGNYGPHLDLMGPAYSSHIYTTVDANTNYSGGETSAATAHVSGSAALLQSAYNLHLTTNVDKPYSVEDIENLLECGSVDAQGNLSSSFSPEFGWGYLNAANSMDFLKQPYVLKHFQGSLSLSQYPPVSSYIQGPLAFPALSGITPGPILRDIEVYRVSTTLSYPESFNSVVRTWGRGNQLSGKEGLSAVWVEPISNSAQPVFLMGYTKVDGFDVSSCDVETFFYRGLNSTGKVQWVPFDPVQAEGILFYYSVLGIKEPSEVGEGIPAVSRFDFEIYPNPITDDAGNDIYLNISSVNHDAKVTISVSTCLGKIVIQKAVQVQGALRVKLDVGNLIQGSYIVTISSAGDTKSRMFLKLK